MGRKQEVFGVTVEGDITGLKNAMNEAVKVFNSTERSLKNAKKAFELDPTDEQALERTVQLYKESIKEQENALKELNQKRDYLISKGAKQTSEEFTTLEKKIKEVAAEGNKLRKELKELPSANIAKVNEKFKKLNEYIKDSDKSLETIRKSLKNIDSQIILDPSNVDLYKQKTKLLNDELNKVNTTISGLKKRQDELRNSPGFLDNNIKSREHVKELTDLSLKIAELEKEAEKLRKELNGNLSPAMSAFVNVADRLGEKLIKISDATKGLSRAFSAIGVASVKSAMDYESSIAQIKRVVSDLSDNTIQDLKNIAVETGNSFKDIAEYAQIGGALGLAEEQLSKFTKDMVDLNTATGGVFGGEEGAKGIAVFLNQLNLGIDKASNFGSAIAVIGDKYADIGDETVNVATKLTGLNSIINTNQYELLGLAGVMADLGLATDTNANGINRAFMQIDKVIAGGVKNSEDKLKELAETSGMTSEEFKKAWGTDAVDAFLRFTDGLKSSTFNEINDAIANSTSHVQDFADVLGMSAEQFKKAWGEDSVKTFNDYVTALGEMDDENFAATKVLSDLGIASVNTAQTLLRLAGNGDEVRDAIELVEQAWNDNTALTEKSGIIYETTASKLKGLYESFKQLGDSIGQVALPYIKIFVDKANDLIKSFNQLDPTTKSLIAKFVALGAVFSPATKSMGDFLKSLKDISKRLKQFYNSDFDYFDKFEKFKNILVALGGANIGAMIAPLVGVAAAVYSISRAVSEYAVYQQYVGQLQDMRSEVGLLNQSLLENVSVADQNYRLREKEIDQVKSQADAVDFLIDRINNEKLSKEERKKVDEEIKSLIDKMNEALGTEAFKFDEVSGKITSQGDEVSKVKDKFAELASELKKQTWLDAHKGVLEEAYRDLDTSSSKMESATNTYIENAQKIPDSVREILQEYNGSLEEFKTMLEANSILFDENEAQGWYDTWEQYRNAIQETQTLVENANNVIDNYMLVADANVETLDSTIDAATEAISIMQTGVSETTTSLGEIVEKRDAYKSTLTEEQTLNDELLEKYNKQIEAMIKQNEYEEHKHGWAEKTNSLVEEYIRANEEWVPEPKIQYIDVVYRGLRSDLGVSYSGGGGSRSGGYNSFGYGDILSSTINSIRSSLGNAYRSGGYRSGGIVVNNSFTVNSNSVGRSDVKEWSSWIIDDINEALGRQM